MGKRRASSLSGCNAACVGPVVCGYIPRQEREVPWHTTKTGRTQKHASRNDVSVEGGDARSQMPNDPTSRRRVGRSMAVIGLVWGLGAAAVVAVVVGLIWGNWAIAIGMGVAAALGAGFISAVVRAEREDGQIEDDVEARGPDANT